jgi:hypothetical protein
VPAVQEDQAVRAMIMPFGPLQIHHSDPHTLTSEMGVHLQ